MRLTTTLAALIGVSYPALAVAQTPAAQAQQSADGAGVLSEIVVTAQRREESLQDVPIAISAMSAEQLQAKGITSLSGLVTNVTPGLVVVPFAGAENQLVFNIRGIATVNPNVGLNDQGVMVYNDGVPQARTYGGGIELADLERIEVLRGPQGTLFGRNSEGGAVQFVSKRPTGKLGGKLEGQIGNYDARRILGQIELPQFANISIKLGGLLDRHDGYIKNKPIGPLDTIIEEQHKDFGYKKQGSFRGSVLWQPSDDFDAYYSYDHSDLRYTNAYQQRSGGPVRAVPGYAAACTGGVSDPAFCGNVFGNLYLNTQQPQPGRVTESSIATYVPLNRLETSGHTLIMTYNATPDVVLKSITGYRDLHERSQNNLAGAAVFVQFLPTSAFNGVGGDDAPIGTLGGVSGLSAQAEVKHKQFSQELQAIGTFDRLQVTAGLFYFEEKINDFRETRFSYAYTYLGQPGVLTPISVTPFVLAPNAQRFSAKATSYAAYVQGSYDVTDQLNISLGLRYTKDKKDFLRTLFMGAPDGLRAPVFKKDRFDPAIIVSYAVSPEINLYAKYSSAYRAGGVGVQNPLALNIYDQEVNKSFEAGFKSELFDRHVRLNVALFRSRITGYQIEQGNDPNNAASTNTINLPSAVTFTGVEGELTYAPVKNLRFGLNGSYLHSKATDTVMDALGTYELLLPNAPKYQLSASIDYYRNFIGETRIFAHADYNYISKYNSNPVMFSSSAFQFAKLSVVNAKIGVEDIDVGGSRVTVAGFVRNLFQSHNASYTYNIRETDAPVFTTRGGARVNITPRTYGLEVRAQF